MFRLAYSHHQADYTNKKETFMSSQTLQMYCYIKNRTQICSLKKKIKKFIRMIFL